MKKAIAIAAVLIIAGIVGARVYAQSSVGSSPLVITPSGPKANCPVPVAGSTFYCFTSDAGLQWSQNGAAYSQIGIVAPTPITINGKTGTTFTVSAGAPTVSVQ